MKFKIFSILGVALCGFLAAVATSNEPEESHEFEPRFAPRSYILNPLPKLKGYSPKTRYYHFELKIIKLSPDGYKRPVWSVNGQYPGPLIQANKGDRIVVNVTNNFGDPATIHWHGIFQRETNWYDGVPGQTQCPIPSRVCFTYNYTLEQSGTYWYHSHFLAQYVDGLVGPLIVHDKDDPYSKSYDEEYVLTVSDWYHSTSAPLLVQRMAPDYTGQYNCSGAPAGYYCNQNVPPATYNVKKGKKYRFRIINTSAYAAFTFSIDNHPLRVIEVEGTPVKNVSAAIVTVLPIHVAQRYSVIVTANQKVDNYYIRASIMENCLLPRTPETINSNSSLNPNATGILHYHGAGSDKPNSTAYPITIDPCQDLNSSAIRPCEASPPPNNFTDEFLFITTFERNDDNVGLLGINNSSFIPCFNNPTNHRIMLKENYREFDTNQNIYAYDTPNGCVDIILLNGQPANHPFHLHGHAFWIMAQGPGATLDNITAYNFKNPVIRDTTMVFANSHLVIRYIADNPGVWAFHCHIEWHVEMGLVAQLIERPTEFSNRTLPDDVRALCMQFNNYKKEKRSTTLPGDSMVKGMRM
ncbi:8149_t:CDS:2, partial [Diversispora eburnea]